MPKHQLTAVRLFEDGTTESAQDIVAFDDALDPAVAVFLDRQTHKIGTEEHDVRCDAIDLTLTLS